MRKGTAAARRKNDAVDADWPAKKKKKTKRSFPGPRKPNCPSFLARSLADTVAEAGFCPNEHFASFEERRKEAELGEGRGGLATAKKKKKNELTPLGAAQQHPPNFALRGPPFCFIVGVPPEPL